MNEFMELIKTYVKSDPSLINDNLENFIYTQLISFNLGKNQKPLVNVTHLFNEWIKRNNYSDEIRTFVDQNHPYFCQFINPSATNIAKDAIKLYIPLDENHLYNGVNLLAEFLTKNKIRHNSKVGKRIRNDNVVVRVSCIEEAEKVINFVANNSYIQEGLLNVNPFTNKICGVGIAEDGLYSYNFKLCGVLSEFIKILYSNNRIDDLNINSFKIFLEEYKLNVDLNSQIIFNQILSVINKERFHMGTFRRAANRDNRKLDKEEIFKRILKETYNKYGMKQAVAALKAFKNNGDVSYFTGLNNRILLVKSISIDDINLMLVNFGITNDEMLQNYVTFVIEQPYDLVVNAYLETARKYGKESADYAIKRYIFDREYKYITNENKAREKLRNVNFDNLINILFEGLNLSTVSSIDELVMIFVEQINFYDKKNL